MNRETKHQLEPVGAKEERTRGAVRLQLPIRVKSQQLQATAEWKTTNSVTSVKAVYSEGEEKKIKPASIVLMCADTHTLGKKRHSSRLRAAGQSRCRRACLELFVWLARLTSH